MLSRTLQFLAIAGIAILALRYPESLGNSLSQLMRHAWENPTQAVTAIAMAILLLTTFKFGLFLVRRLMRHPDTYIPRLHSVQQLNHLETSIDLDTRTRRARHEAAHAVVYMALGFAVIEVSIVPHKSSGGHTTARSEHSPDHWNSDVHHHRMIGTVAGNLVDLDNGFHDFGSSDDYKSMLEDVIAILSSGIPPKTHQGPLTLDALIISAREHAQNILAANQNNVQEITKLLLAKSTLGPSDLVPFQIRRNLTEQ